MIQSSRSFLYKWQVPGQQACLKPCLPHTPKVIKLSSRHVDIFYFMKLCEDRRSSGSLCVLSLSFGCLSDLGIFKCAQIHSHSPSGCSDSCFPMCLTL